MNRRINKGIVTIHLKVETLKHYIQVIRIQTSIDQEMIISNLIVLNHMVCMIKIDCLLVIKIHQKLFQQGKGSNNIIQPNKVPSLTCTLIQFLKLNSLLGKHQIKSTCYKRTANIMNTQNKKSFEKKTHLSTKNSDT